MRLIPKSTTNQSEHILTVSNLVFLAISQLEIRHLEIIKKVSSKKMRPRELVEVISSEMRMLPSRVIRDLETLSEMRVIYHKRNSDEVVELTETGKLIAEEIMREV